MQAWFSRPHHQVMSDAAGHSCCCWWWWWWWCRAGLWTGRVSIVAAGRTCRSWWRSVTARHWRQDGTQVGAQTRQVSLLLLLTVTSRHRPATGAARRHVTRAPVHMTRDDRRVDDNPLLVAVSTCRSPTLVSTPRTTCRRPSRTRPTNRSGLTARIRGSSRGRDWRVGGHAFPPVSVLSPSRTGSQTKFLVSVTGHLLRKLNDYICCFI